VLKPREKLTQIKLQKDEGKRNKIGVDTVDSGVRNIGWDTV
jgi:hypothetical protein